MFSIILIICGSILCAILIICFTLTELKELELKKIALQATKAPEPLWTWQSTTTYGPERPKPRIQKENAFPNIPEPPPPPAPKNRVCKEGSLPVEEEVG